MKRKLKFGRHAEIRFDAQVFLVDQSLKLSTSLWWKVATIFVAIEGSRISGGRISGGGSEAIGLFIADAMDERMRIYDSIFK